MCPIHLNKIRGIESKKLEGKKVVLGVTGSIAAIESIKLSRELIRRGAEVIGVLSEGAQSIIRPTALEFSVDRLVKDITGKIEHVSMFEEADLLLIAPATASTISKVANGITDTSVSLAASMWFGKSEKSESSVIKPVIFVPSMHENMLNNPLIGQNILKLKNAGAIFVSPLIEENKAKFPDVNTICLYVERALSPWDFEGKRVVVTSGPTYEHLDPIRFLSNKSSGTMGREIAFELWRRGADVIHITSKPSGVALDNFSELNVLSVSDMLETSLAEVNNGCDLFVSAAAPSDFLVMMNDSKIKTSEELVIRLTAAPKIIKELRKTYKGQIIGFKAETGVSDEGLYKIAYDKLIEDGLEMVVANDVSEKGMGTKDSRVLIVTKDDKKWSEGFKNRIAEDIVDTFVECVL